MKPVLRAAVIGAGLMGLQHIEAIRRIPGAQVVALADADGAHAAAVGERLQIPACYSDYRQMIREQRPDVVHNCTPNHLHYQINAQLLEQGIHVYCEKPLALNSQETGLLCRLARESRGLAAVNFNYRHNAAVREMRQRVEDREGWGRTHLIRGRYLQDWMLYDTDFNWRCVSGCGGQSRAVADIGSHFFDLVQYVTGQRIARVNARLRTVFPQRRQGGPGGEPVAIDTEDEAVILFELEDGTLGTVTVSQVCAGAKNDLALAVDGSRYSMCWEQEDADKLWISSREEGRRKLHAGAEFLHGDAKRYATLPSGHPLGWHDALRNAIQAFYDTIREGAPVNYTTFEEGDYVMRVVEACLESGRRGCWVEVPRP